MFKYSWSLNNLHRGKSSFTMLESSSDVDDEYSFADDSILDEEDTGEEEEWSNVLLLLKMRVRVVKRWPTIG